MRFWEALTGWWTRREAEQALAEAERRHREVVARREALERQRDIIARRGPRRSP